MISSVLSIFSTMFLPVLITVILVYGLRKKTDIYDVFIEGAKDGLGTCVEILPFIIGIFIAIEALTSSGAMDFIEKAVAPIFDFFSIPEELISLIFLRPVSGSGSLVVAEQIMDASGPDSLVGRAASVMVGSSLLRCHLRKKNEAFLHRRPGRVHCRHLRLRIHMYDHVT